MIYCVPKRGCIHAFCDGLVNGDGRAGCAVLLWEYYGRDNKYESSLMFRMSDNVSSTQTELHAIYVVLCKTQDRSKNAFIFTDSRAALDSLSSRERR